MDDDAFARFIEGTSASEAARNREHVEREVQAALRAKRVRWRLRYSIIATGLLGMGSLMLGLWLEAGPLIVFGFVCLLACIGPGVVLLFKGGLALGNSEKFLSERDRKRLNN